MKLNEALQVSDKKIVILPSASFKTIDLNHHGRDEKKNL